MQFGHRSLRDANCARQLEWDAKGETSLAFFGNELGGEVGEALNVLKKLERERMGIRGSRASVSDLAEELADCVVVMDLIGIKAEIPFRTDTAQFEAPKMSPVLLGCQLVVGVGRVCNKIIEMETTGRDCSRSDSLGLRLDDCMAVINRIANGVGIDVMSSVSRKFNLTSKKYGLTTRMEEPL